MKTITYTGENPVRLPVGSLVDRADGDDRPPHFAYPADAVTTDARTADRLAASGLWAASTRKASGKGSASAGPPGAKMDEAAVPAADEEV